MSRIPTLIAVVWLFACSSDSPLEPLDGLPHALATNSCGPTDAPIVLVYLASQPVDLQQPVSPFLQVHIPVSFTELTRDAVFEVGESFHDANAWFYRSGLETTTATRGEVGVSHVSAGAISGFVDLEFEDGTRLRGSFSASWQPRQLLCG